MSPKVRFRRGLLKCPSSGNCHSFYLKNRADWRFGWTYPFFNYSLRKLKQQMRFMFRVKYHYTIPRNKWELQLPEAIDLSPLHYTIPRNKWELQLEMCSPVYLENYTIPRNKWELQRKMLKEENKDDYTIPRNKWELQQSITYI